MPASPSPISRSVPGNPCWSRWLWSDFGLQRAREIWDSAASRSRVIVAVIDDGFDVSHPALRGKLWQMPGQPRVHGWNMVEGDGNLSPATETPVSSHGTMVAGIIGGRADPLGSFAGVAPNVALMLLRWRSNYPREAHANPINMAAALRFAIAHNARIINLSAGIDTTRKSARALAELRRAFKLAETRNVLVVVAAPNTPENMDAATVFLPGVYPFTNLIHVTGLCRELKLVGAWGEKSVDLAGPAEDIIGPTAGGGYRSGCATSFAAALVTGALALVWGLLPNLQADQLRRLILRNAKSTAHQDSIMEGPRPCRTKKQPAVGVCRLQPHEVWGHQYPATPEGRLNLGFVEKAWEQYREGGSYPGCFPPGVKGTPGTTCPARNVSTRA